MRSVILQPHVGVLGLRFGMDRDGARGLLGIPHHSFRKGVEVDAWLDGNLHVFYSENGTGIEYIEVFPAESYAFMCFGNDLFRRRAGSVLRALKRRSGCTPSDEEQHTRYTFAAQELALWRPFASLWGEGAYFASAGIGRAGYFTAAAT